MEFNEMISSNKMDEDRVQSRQELEIKLKLNFPNYAKIVELVLLPNVLIIDNFFRPLYIFILWYVYNCDRNQILII